MKVEVAVLGSPSLTVFMVSVDLRWPSLILKPMISVNVKQHSTDVSSMYTNRKQQYAFHMKKNRLISCTWIRMGDLAVDRPAWWRWAYLGL